MDDVIFVDSNDYVVHRDSEYLIHYGLDHIESTVGRGSGRYAYGSGKNPGQHPENMTLAQREEFYQINHPEMTQTEIAEKMGFVSVANMKKAIEHEKLELNAKKRPEGITLSEWQKQLEAENPGMTSREIANQMGFASTTTLVKAKAAETKILKAKHIAEVTELKNQGLSIAEIERQTGYSASTIRDWLKPSAKEKSDAEMNVATVLKKELEERKDIVGLDVGLGASNIMGVSKGNLDAALAILEQEGYKIHKVQVQQQASGNLTTMYVLGTPDSEWKNVVNNKDKIGIINDRSVDGGHDLEKFVKQMYSADKIENLSSDRIMVRYGDEGGKELDGIIELRPGAEGLDMGANRYCQVRIGVDGTHYMKGMAVYGDPKDFPKGIDVIYNSNKPSGTPLKAFKEDGSPGKFAKDGQEVVLKPQDLDPTAINPFGSNLKPDGELRNIPVGKKGYLNIVNEQGDWHKWSRNLSSQFLSKQPEKLIKDQLNYKKIMKDGELAEIREVTQPEVKRQLLLKFADKCDSDAVELKAAPMSQQNQGVLIGLKTLKDNEIYAPQYNTGDKVVLIRYPHAGQFEIPELTVNNRNREGSRIIGKDSVDAVGVTARTAAILSGADYDGDSVVVINNNAKKVKTQKPYDELINFDPQTAYPGYDGMTKVGSYKDEKTGKKYGDGFNKGMEMGSISNLITDMTIKGAAQGQNADEIIRAVKYSMVVIDAEKHQLNWKQAKQDLQIDDLKKKYLGVNKNGQPKGASTIISRSSAREDIPQIVPNSKKINKDGTVSYTTMDEDKRIFYKYIDKETGKRVYKPTAEDLASGRIKKEKVIRTTKSKKMKEVDDASILSSGTRKESYYVDYANHMKELARTAREEAVNIPAYKINRSAAETYAAQIRSLDAKYNMAMREKPYERKANAVAEAVTSLQRKKNPSLKDDKDEMKKIKNRNLTAARETISGRRKKYKITLDDDEWNAIQSQAMTMTRCAEIISVCDLDDLRERATPRTKSGLTPAQIATARRLLKNDDYTIKDVASRLGVSTSTLYNALN